MGGPRFRTLRAKLARWAVVSTVLAQLAGFVNTAAAHELRPAIADVSVAADSVTVVVELALEALVAEVDVSVIDNTDESPNAARYDTLREMVPTALEAELRAAWPNLAGNFLLAAGDTALQAQIAEVAIPDVGDMDLVRDTVLTLTAALPDDGSDVTVGWTANNGPLVIRQIDAGDNAYSALLDGGRVSEPMPRQSGGGGLFQFLFGD